MRISMTLEQLEQALQDSELQEILHDYDNREDTTPRNVALRQAIIARLFLWQRVNDSLKKRDDEYGPTHRVVNTARENTHG